MTHPKLGPTGQRKTIWPICRNEREAQQLSRPARMVAGVRRASIIFEFNGGRGTHDRNAAHPRVGPRRIVMGQRAWNGSVA